MNNSHQQPFNQGRSTSENEASVFPAPRVQHLPDGTVQLTYTSQAAYLHDLKLLKGTDRLTNLATEVQTKIVKYLIPNRGRIAIGYDYYGPNTSGIRSGSLAILRVSRRLSNVALQVLYGYRWFRVSVSTHYRRPDIEKFFQSAAEKHLETRWNVLRQNTDHAHPLNVPLDCFSLLVFHTPAHQFLTRLEIMINQNMGEVLIDGKLLRALHHAKGLRLLELFMGTGVPDIMPFVYELDHIRTIKVLSWLGKDVLYEKQLAKRNKSWIEPLQATGSV